jgi:methenyltetrahydromethanopterin cyclohydrolase
MRVLREFPALSAARTRRAAQSADRAAYADAVAEYAALGSGELRAAALRAIGAPGRG